ncbi:MAG: DbpA RNA binding domain-containing protein [Treponemataceae bacterium]
MKDNLLNDEDFTSFIERTLNKMKTEGDVEQLNADRKLFRKSVSFGMRSYFASYLVRRLVSNTRNKRNSQSRRRSVPKISFSPDVSTTLFFNIGRSRKMFYRDIIYLIMNNADVKRESIGEIKIHNNYSFVQVENEAVKSIMENLNDMSYRGKKLVVNKANEKPERNYNGVSENSDE